MNARGTPLLASDLVKNHLLRQADEAKLQVEELWKCYWKPFEADRWRKEVQLGRIYWPRLDAFLFYWLGMHLTREVGTRRLFKEFLDYSSDCQLSSQYVFEDLARVGQTFDLLDNISDEDDTEQSRFFYRWRTSQLRVLTPLLLWLFDNKVEIGDVGLMRSLRAIESWFIRRMICKTSTQGYQNFSNMMLREIKQQPVASVPDAILEILCEADAVNTRWPSDEDVAEAVCQRPLYRQLSRGRLRLVLESIEDRLRQTKGMSEQLCPRKLTFEHIMPVGWSPDSWPLPGRADNYSQAETDRSALIHTLGNLTLLNSKLNPSLSNAAWEQKRAGLKEHSVLLLNKKLASRSVWDEDSIRERGEEMASAICAIWLRLRQ